MRIGGDSEHDFRFGVVSRVSPCSQKERRMTFSFQPEGSRETDSDWSKQSFYIHEKINHSRLYVILDSMNNITLANIDKFDK